MNSLRMHTVVYALVIAVLAVSCSDDSKSSYPPAGPSGGGGSSELSALQADRDVKLLREIVAREPENVDAWIKLGNIFMDTGKFQEAVDAYGAALAIDPKNVNVRVDMGTCYRSLGDPVRAVEEYRKAIAVKPDHVYAYKNLGVVLAFDLQRNAEAIKAFREYLKLAPNAPDALQISNLIDELKKKSG
ncbi:MAG: tetratricopeptide repeat protein [bacterium]